MPVSARSRSSRSTASPAGVSVPRSPPEPFTHISSTSSPVTGSVAAPLAEVLPPAKLVFRGSAPSRLDRAISSSISASLTVSAPSGRRTAHPFGHYLLPVARPAVGRDRVRIQAGLLAQFAAHRADVGPERVHHD